MENEAWRLPSNNDKKGDDSTKEVTNQTSFHINSCQMSNPVEHTFNSIVAEAEEAQAARSTISTPPLLLTTPQGQERLTAVLNANPPLKTPSPTPTDNLHLGYPYREYIGNEADLPDDVTPHSYLSAQVNRCSGEPRVLGTAGKNEPVYDEAPLVAQSHRIGGDDLEMDDEHTVYPFGENAYLDPDFLRALGDLDDRGLAADALCLLQLDGELRYLDHWEKAVRTCEQEVVRERGELIQKQQAAFRRRKTVYERLRQAGAALRLQLQFPEVPNHPLMGFDAQFNSPHPLDRQQQGGCH